MNERVSQILPFGLRAPSEVMAWIGEKAVEQRRSKNFVIVEILKVAKQQDELKEAA